MLRSIGSGAGASVAVLVALAAQGPAETAAAAGTPAVTAPTASPPRTSDSPNPSAPGAGDLVITNPQAVACQDAAKFGDFDGAGIGQCTLALASPLLSRHDLAATHTDRGAVYLQHRQYARAKSDFDAALALDPSVADAYVNRGAALLAMGRYADAIADIDHGLSLGPDQPEKAYFNRAIADEHLSDLSAAYQDYLKASQLNPGWQAPKAELARLRP